MLAGAAFLLCSAFLASAERALTVDLVTKSTDSTDITDSFINVTVKNTGDEKLSILPDPRSVLSTHPTDRLSIWRPMFTVFFAGIHARYIPEFVVKANIPDSIVVLEPGQSEHIVCDLSVYLFSLPPPLTYLIKPPRFLIVETDGSISSIQPHSNGVNVTIESNGTVFGGTSSAQAPYNGCSASQKYTIGNATALAQKYVDKAFEDSQKDPKSDPKSAARFLRWFGGNDINTYNTVRASLQDLRGRIKDQSYDCTCSSPDLAGFVHASWSYDNNLLLCTQYWNLPATGAGSQVDTIINLGAYFNIHPLAHGLAYGQSDSLSLAKSGDTISATANPDNYAYYAAEVWSETASGA